MICDKCKYALFFKQLNRKQAVFCKAKNGKVRWNREDCGYFANRQLEDFFGVNSFYEKVRQTTLFKVDFLKSSKKHSHNQSIICNQDNA